MQIELGAMSPKLSKQLAATKIPKDRLKVLDKLADSRTWLYLHGILTDAESEKAAHRLIAKVQKELNGANIPDNTRAA